MVINYFSLSDKEQKKLIQLVAEEQPFPFPMIEKDLWICWVLQHLFELPHNMAFKGGTSLSKVYSLIHRFSEDVDITFDYKMAEPTLEMSTHSKSYLKKLSENLKQTLQKITATSVVPHLEKMAKTLLPHRDTRIELNDKGDELKFYYPSLIEASTSIQNSYLRNYVLIEFGMRNTTEPSETHTINTILEKTLPEIKTPIPQIKVLKPHRTFWEKATLIHVECHRGRLQECPERLFRHWYDIALLAKTNIAKEAIKDTLLLTDVITHKKAFFNASYANYDACLKGKFKLIPSLLEQKALEKDFNAMVNSGMFYVDPPPFEITLEILFNLESMINENCQL